MQNVSDECRLASPSKALRPVSISYSTAPKAKMSVRASASLPSSCSGAMYCSVPRIVPCASGAAGNVGRGLAAHDGLLAQLGQAEVQQLRPRLREHDVAGLQVAVDDAGAVRGGERIGDLDRRTGAPGRAAACRARAAPPASRRPGTPSRGSRSRPGGRCRTAGRCAGARARRPPGPRARTAAARQGRASGPAGSTLMATVRSSRVSRAL